MYETPIWVRGVYIQIRMTVKSYNWIDMEVRSISGNGYLWGASIFKSWRRYGIGEFISTESDQKNDFNNTYCILLIYWYEELYLNPLIVSGKDFRITPHVKQILSTSIMRT